MPAQCRKDDGVTELKIRAAELAAERPTGWVHYEHFPTSLVTFAVETWSKPEDRVLDPLAGPPPVGLAVEAGEQAKGDAGDAVQ